MTWENVDDTGFYIVCSAVDKSIWAVFNFHPMTETGDYLSINPQAGEKFGKLPNDEGLTIGVQRLFGTEWLARTPLKLDDGDLFESPLGGGLPIEAMITAKPVACCQNHDPPPWVCMIGISTYYHVSSPAFMSLPPAPLLVIVSG